MIFLLILVALLLIVVLFLGISFWSALPEEPPLERNEKDSYIPNPGGANKEESQDN